MRTIHTILFLPLLILLFSSCHKEKAQQLEKQVQQKDEQIEQLEEQVDHLQSTNNSLLDRMSDLSIISKEGSESIKESLKSINQQYAFIEDLTTKIQAKDSLNLALVMNLKRSLNDIYDEDVQVEVRGGVVHVSISDKLLFETGSYRVNEGAYNVLSKVASIINDHDQLNVLVEGHTDDVPISNSRVQDNWELSIQRAASVVRILEQEYDVTPERLTAAGRSKYVPKAENDSPQGRSQNRRTEIIITPKMDQFFELLEAPELAG